MAEPILVTGKRISDMELVTVVVGTEKVPTGQAGDLAITPDQIAQHVITKGDFATQEDLSQVEINLQTQIANTNLELTNQTTQTRALITAETQARIQGDGNLSDRIDAIDVDIDTVETNLAAETAARIAADALKVDILGSVKSVSGRTGDVVLTPADIGYPTLPDLDLRPKNASTIIDSSGLTQQQINDRAAKARLVDLSYMEWPTGYDVSAVLDAAIKLSQQHPIHLIIPHGDFVASTPVSTGTNGKGIILDLNGSTIKPTVGYTSPDWYLIDLQSTTNFPAILVNGVVDGVNRKQNLFEYTVIADYFRDATSGVHLVGKHVELKNFKFKNLYGQTTKFQCTTFDVSDVDIDNCGGHWYVNDGYDMFGDMFYVGTGSAVEGVVSGTFKNVRGRAKYSSQYAENHQAGSPLTQVQYSRAGLVLENFGGTQNTAYITFENCDLRYVERGIHQEIEGITSHITYINSRMDCCVLFGAYITDTVNGYARDSYFGFYGSAYNGSKGLTRAYGGVSASYGTFENCVVEYFAEDDCKVFGVSGHTTAINTTFKNVTGMWAESSTVKLRNCDVDVKKHFTENYPAWLTSWDIEGGSFTYTGADNVLRTYTADLDFKLKDTAFTNIYLASLDTLNGDKFEDVKLIVNNDSTLTAKGTRWKIVKKDGGVIQYPHVLWGADEILVDEGKYLYEKYTKPTSGTLNLISPQIQKLSERVSLMMIIVKGHHDLGNTLPLINATDYGAGYYVAIAKRDHTLPDKVKLVSGFTSVGSTVDSGFDLTIDANFNITAYGTYSGYVHVGVVPMSQRETLPFVPDAMI